MKKWSFGYALVKLFVQFAFWMSHKRIVVIGKENIPKNKPIIFAPNHQNALMDPLAVLCTNFTQPVWLARADIFKMKATRAILRFFKIMPVYRIRDGKNSLGMNESIFAQAIEVLENKKALALFPEAAHSGKRQMLPHKKAIPRIAFLAEEKNNFQLQLQVVPVGIYYSHYWHFNRELIVNYGAAIDIDSYQNEYEIAPQQAALSLRDEIEKRVDSLILNIRSKAHYDNYELFRELMGKEFAKSGQFHKKQIANRFFSDRQLIKTLEKKEQENPLDFFEIHQKADHLRELLTKNQFSIRQLKNINHPLSPLLLQALLALLLVPFICMGFLLHAIPFFIPRTIIQKKIKDPTFYSTFQFVAGMLAYLLYCALLETLVLYFSNQWSVIILAIPTFFIIGKLSFIAFQFIRNTFSALRLWSFLRKNKDEAKNMTLLKEIIRVHLFQV